MSEVDVHSFLKASRYISIASDLLNVKIMTNKSPASQVTHLSFLIDRCHLRNWQLI